MFKNIEKFRNKCLICKNEKEEMIAWEQIFRDANAPKRGWDYVKTHYDILNKETRETGEAAWKEFLAIKGSTPYLDIRYMTANERIFNITKRRKTKKKIHEIYNEDSPAYKVFRQIEKLRHEIDHPNSEYIESKIKGDKPSVKLNNMAEMLVQWCIPKDQRSGGRVSSQGVYRGKDKMGNVILTPNYTVRGKGDVGFEYKFTKVEFWAESKTTDSQLHTQSEFQKWKESTGSIYVIFHNLEELMPGWIKWCRINWDKMPNGSIVVTSTYEVVAIGLYNCVQNDG